MEFEGTRGTPHTETPAHLGILRHEHPGTGTACTAASLVPVPVDYSDCLGAVGQKKGEACISEACSEMIH